MFMLISCSNDDDVLDMDEGQEEQEQEAPADFKYDEGFLISNEGPFNNGFGSVSYVSSDLNTLTNDIFQAENMSDNLGNIVNSIGFTDNQAYVVSNVSNWITVVDRFSFVETGRISSGLENPRYFVALNGKGYVTNWGDPLVETDDYIAVINLRTLNVDATIPVGLGPEKIVYDGNQLYVAHKGGFGTNNIVTVINPTDDTVVTTIAVGDVPESMALDSQGNLWVLSSGKPAFTMEETGGRIQRINTASNTVVFSSEFDLTSHPSYLNIDNDQLYFFLDGGVYVGNALDYLVPTTAQLDVGFYYNMAVINGKLFGCNAGDFSGAGTLEVYDLATNALEAILNVGVVPGNVYLNQ
jgi:YVTN family beta-propeller protein